MSVAQQAIAARRRARQDERYAGQARKDSVRAAARERAKAEAEQIRRMRSKGAKK